MRKPYTIVSINLGEPYDFGLEPERGDFGRLHASGIRRSNSTAQTFNTSPTLRHPDGLAMTTRRLRLWQFLWPRKFVRRNSLAIFTTCETVKIIKH